MTSAISKQQQYRRLMKEKKSSLQQSKIDHPLAKYNSLGQLLCLVCNIQIKSEVLWNTHLQSKKHKDCVQTLKAKKPTPTPAVQPSVLPAVEPSDEYRGKGKGRVDKGKGRAKDSSASSVKRRLSDDDSTTQQPPVKKKSKKKHANTAAPPSGLPAGFFDSGVSKKFRPHGEEVFYESSDSEGEVPVTEGVPQATSVSTLPSSLPTDFFDRGGESIPSASQRNGSSSTKSKADLPEGFFDDPKMDAKARKVEYKDPMAEEWEKFQKSIQKENDVSEVIVFEEDEEDMEEREVDEVNQQVNFFTKAEQLRQRHEQLLAHKTERAQSSSEQVENRADTHSSAEEENEDFDEFLSWRAKIS